MLLPLIAALLLQGDSVYASPGLRAVVARAAEGNRAAPLELQSYRARVESEAALIIHTVDGEELTGQIEQIASRIEWQRAGEFAQRIVGHRVQAAGPGPSVISYLRRGWMVPVLYGERLGFFGVDIGEARARRGPAYQVIHPFSERREQLYRFAGGDTIAVLRLGERDVRVQRIRVTPRRAPDDRILAFHGDIDLDADRHQIIRMRGRLVVFQPEPNLGVKLLSFATRGFAYIELENAEHEGRYWLPHRQRIELQATSGLTDSRAVVRIVSDFREHTTVAAAVAAAVPQEERSRLRFRLTFAPADTLARYSDWSLSTGESTAGLSARDFDDVAPPALQMRGPPHLRVGATRMTDVLRYNRVEGLYTGLGAVLALRDAAPGLELRAAAGGAWSEQTVRGRIEALLRRSGWEYSARAARDLDHTNDFTAPLEQGMGMLMLFGANDDFDYVDRRSLSVGVTRDIGRGRDTRVRLDAGWVDDRPEPRRLLHGPYGGDTLRLNRPVTPGSYVLTRLALERHRSVNPSSLQPGLGARLLLEQASGELDWRRIHADVNLRTTRGRVTFVSRLDGGMLFGNPPLQSILELGTANGLPGYAYKEFGGDRAALLRAIALYDLPLFDAPIRLGSLILPGISPTPVMEYQAGWTATRAGTLPALQALGSRETDGVRSTLAFRLAFFGSAFAVGVARPLEQRSSWRWVWTVGGVL